jgi:hypothetical protein
MRQDEWLYPILATVAIATLYMIALYMITLFSP